MSARQEASASPPLLPVQADPRTVSKRGRGALAIAGTFVLPGLGHVFASRFKRGVFFFVLSSVLQLTFLFCVISPARFTMAVVIAPIALLVVLWGFVDGYLVGHRSTNKMLGRPVWRYLAAVVLVIMNAIANPLTEVGLNYVHQHGKGYHTPSVSMSQTLIPGDRFMMHTGLPIRRWDMVVFRSPADGSAIVKRVVGLPGETVEIKRDGLVINQVAVTPPETYIRYVVTDSRGRSLGTRGIEGNPVTVGAAEYFILGDNSEASSDSRMYGCINESSVLGRVTSIYWPISRWRRF